MGQVADKPDLDSPENIEAFVDAFYSRLLQDEQLAPIFIDVAAIDLDVHLPHIKRYWRKLLLGERDYQRHTMNIHRQLHGQRPLQASDFARWLSFFTDTVDDNFCGPKAEQAKRTARTISANMQKSLPG